MRRRIQRPHPLRYLRPQPQRSMHIDRDRHQPCLANSIVRQLLNRRIDRDGIEPRAAQHRQRRRQAQRLMPQLVARDQQNRPALPHRPRTTQSLSLFCGHHALAPNASRRLAEPINVTTHRERASSESAPADFAVAVASGGGVPTGASPVGHLRRHSETGKIGNFPCTLLENRQKRQARGPFPTKEKGGFRSPSALRVLCELCGEILWRPTSAPVRRWGALPRGSAFAAGRRTTLPASPAALSGTHPSGGWLSSPKRNSSICCRSSWRASGSARFSP